MNQEQRTFTDERWGGYIPWFLRYQDFPRVGNFPLFFSRISQRLQRLLLYNEAGIVNLDHFGSWLESETLQRFRHVLGGHLSTEISKFFDSEIIESEIIFRMYNDPEMVNTRNRPHRGLLITSPEIERLRSLVAQTENRRREYHKHCLIIERIGVLEALLRILPNQTSWVSQLKQDIRKYFAEAGIMLDIRDNPPLIVPTEEPLLQKEVLDQLLPRLAAQFPERAKELVKAYHDSISAKNLDTVFSEAFKTLEEIARSITGDKSFAFDTAHLRKHFPQLHPTIHETMKRLAGHRGDEAGHARSAPDPHEIRYLLFSICNLALLLLDYPGKNLP